MKIIRGVKQIEAPLTGSVVTIGNFDGVHLGHRRLMARTLELAKQLGVASVVMTFDPHPVKVLYPDREVRRIFDFDDQKEQLSLLGVDYLVIEPFSREFSNLAAERYVQDFIFKPFQPKALVVGYDFSFGANKSGTIDFLRQQSQMLNFFVEVIPPVKVGDILVSSSRIRQALSEGDLPTAERLLGRRFYLQGIVEKGKGRGRTIGVPTANINANVETLPSEGVYCGFVLREGERKKCVMNIGRNPTFENQRASPILEVHLLDFNEDLYGETLRVELKQKLRGEKKFASIDELVAQIQRDIRDAREIL